MHLIRCRDDVRRVRVAVVGALAVVTVLLAACGSPAEAPPRPSVADRLGAAVDRFVDESLSAGIRNRRAVLVAVDNETVVERYYDSSAEETAAVASVTKSFVGTLVGIAVSQGLLELDQTLGGLLPTYADRMSPEMRGVTVRQLLTMTAGFPRTEGDPPPPAGPDWVADIVERGLDRPPGEGFAYSNGSSHLLAAILSRVTGQSVLDYARQVLLDPLGIDTRPAFEPRIVVDKGARPAYERAHFAWPRDPQGIAVGFGYAKMGAEDMLRLGQLYLDDGQWDGEQLVPREWVEEATSSAVDTGNGFGGDGYGYHWWMTSAGDHPAFAAVGYGGQLVEVVPDLRLVVAASTWIDDTTSFDSRIWQTMIESSLVPELE